MENGQNGSVELDVEIPVSTFEQLLELGNSDPALGIINATAYIKVQQDEAMKIWSRILSRRNVPPGYA